MGWASRFGKARVSARNPQAAAVCDRCGAVYNHNDLRFQFEFGGAGLYNKQILVCESCEDRPQPQLKAYVLPPDPVPILNPRPENYAYASTDYRVTSGQDRTDKTTGINIPGGDRRTTEEDDNRIIQKNGDALFPPKLVKNTRITSYLDRRKTQEDGTRVTEPMPDIPVRRFIKKTRTTSQADTRIATADQNNATRVIVTEDK